MDKISIEEAFALIEKGEWITSGGYTYTNTDPSVGGGYYLAWGDYPGSIRGGRRHTIQSLKAHGQWYTTSYPNVRDR